MILELNNKYGSELSKGLGEKRVNYTGGSIPINENKSSPDIKSRKILKAINITNIKQISSVFSFPNDLP